MNPKRLSCPPEAESTVSVEDVERVLDADYVELGKAEKTIQKLKEILTKLNKE